MPTFYSPNGNPEMWGEKPDGYFTPEEWKVLHPRPLEEVKADKLVEISVAYSDFDKYGTVNTSFDWPIQIGQEHCQKLDGAIRFAEKTGMPSIYITDANNETHYDVTLVDANQVLIEQMGAALGAHAKKQELRMRIEAATTNEEVEAIHW